MDDLRKRILLDLFVTPTTVVPTTIGVSLLMLSAVLGGYTAFAGFLGVLVGFGALLTNLIFNLGRITSRAAKRWHQQQAQKKEAELDELDAKLVQTRDARDQTALRNLRALYRAFCDDVRERKISKNVPATMFTVIEELFKTCINKLERSFDIWTVSQTVTHDIQARLRKQRDDLVTDVEGSVAHLAETIGEVRALTFKTEKAELQQLKRKMVSQLEVAKATEERLASLDQDTDWSRFAEYEQQA
jgi:hypothetical protein